MTTFSEVIEGVSEAWFIPATEAETETVHSSVSACSFVITGSHSEVCDVSSIEATEATEEKGMIRSFHPSPLPSSICLCFRLRNTRT